MNTGAWYTNKGLFITFYTILNNFKLYTSQTGAPGSFAEVLGNSTSTPPVQYNVVGNTIYNVNPIDFGLGTYVVVQLKTLDGGNYGTTPTEAAYGNTVEENYGSYSYITLNDIVEEIVGEINDEFNQDDIVYNKIDNNTFVFEGKVNLTDLYRILKIKDNKIFEKIKGDSETLGGFLLEQIGFFPKKNFKLKLKGIEFKIVEVNRKRIKSIMVVIKK